MGFNVAKIASERASLTISLTKSLRVAGILDRNEYVNEKDNEFNSAATSLLWHPPQSLCRGQFNVKIALSENIALLLHRHVDVPYSLVVTYIDFGWQIVPP